MAPVATIESKYDGSLFSGDDRRHADDSWNEIAKLTSAQLLRFYLGASF
jgi:hypothetical protein